MEQDRTAGPLCLSQRGLPRPEPRDARFAGHFLHFDRTWNPGPSRIPGSLGQSGAAERNRRTQQGELKGGKFHGLTEGGYGSTARPIRRA